jgi:hypothetical protein
LEANQVDHLVPSPNLFLDAARLGRRAFDKRQRKRLQATRYRWRPLAAVTLADIRSTIARGVAPGAAIANQVRDVMRNRVICLEIGNVAGRPSSELASATAIAFN